jgi:hypothetical protein
MSASPSPSTSHSSTAKSGSSTTPKPTTQVRPYIYRHERKYYRPTLCWYSTPDRIYCKEKQRRVIRDSLRDIKWNMDVRQIVDEILVKASEAGPTFDEIPLNQYLCKNSLEGGELSICPLCFSLLIPGRGVHFALEPHFDVEKKRSYWTPHWIRNRRIGDSRENRNFLNFTRTKVTEVVESCDVKTDFSSLWHQKYRDELWTSIPRKYVYVLVL